MPQLYNEDIKLGYIEEIPDDKNAKRKRALLSSIANYEEQIGKDLGEMNKEEILTALGQCGASSYNALIAKCQYARQYLAWYSVNVRPLPIQQTYFSWEEVDLAPRWKYEMIKSPEDIVSDWHGFPPSYGDYVQPLFILCWHGISFKEALTINNDDVILQGKTVVIVRDGEITKITDPTSVKVLTEYKNYEGHTLGNLTYVPLRTDKYFYKTKSLAVADNPRSLALSTNGIGGTIMQRKIKIGEWMVRKYDSVAVLNAGDYYRVIQYENSRRAQGEIGYVATEDEVFSLTKRMSRQQQQVKATMYSIKKFREVLES